MLTLCCKTCVFLADVKDDSGDSPLDVAVRWNKLDIALYLISHGFGSDDDKHKVFISACHTGELKVVKKLVEQHSIDPKGEHLLTFSVSCLMSLRR